MLLALAGAADNISAVFRATIMLSATPESMRGRLTGIEFMQVASAPTLGNLESGVVASLTSLRFSIVSGGILVRRRDGRRRRALPGAAPLRREARQARMTALRRDFFERSVHDVAPELIGATLLVDGVGGIVVEVEAYDHEDPAAHGFRGRPPQRVDVRPAGHAYVYRSYGVHWCLNFVCEDVGVASAVLIRALEPVDGIDTMRARRGVATTGCCAPGPGRLCQALGITREHDGLPLDEPPFELLARETRPELVRGPRIGITKAAERPWRYGLAGSRFLSRPFPREPHLEAARRCDTRARLLRETHARACRARSGRRAASSSSFTQRRARMAQLEPDDASARRRGAPAGRRASRGRTTTASRVTGTARARR